MTLYRTYNGNGLRISAEPRGGLEKFKSASQIMGRESEGFKWQVKSLERDGFVQMKQPKLHSPSDHRLTAGLRLRRLSLSLGFFFNKYK